MTMTVVIQRIESAIEEQVFILKFGNEAKTTAGIFGCCINTNEWLSFFQNAKRYGCNLRNNLLPSNYRKRLQYNKKIAGECRITATEGISC